MNQALWLLLKLRFKGFLRRLGRQFQTIRGAITVIFFALMMLMWLGSMVMNMVIASTKPESRADPVQVERFAPVGLLFYCLMTVISNGATSPVVFNPPEVQFLFAGPFSRRQILAYKLTQQFLLSLPFTLFMMLATRMISGSILSSFLGVLNIVLFLQLFAVAVGLTVSYLGEWAYGRLRQVTLLLLLAVFVTAIAFSLRTGEDPSLSMMERLKQVEQSTVLQVILAPFRWFVWALMAESLFPDLLIWGSVGLAINLGLLILIFALDASFLETAAAVSERRYAALERMRRGNMPGSKFGPDKPQGKVRFSLPPFPNWGGIGPIAWRQLLAGLRNMKALSVLLVVIGLSAMGPIIGAISGKDDNAMEALPWILCGMGLFMTSLMNMFLAFDFRGDLDRLDVLKTWPIPAWRIAVGQLIAPVVMTSAIQMALAITVYLSFGTIGPLAAAVVVFAVPVNMMLIGFENFVFLLFPVRMVQAGPGDFSQAGRHMLLMFGKMLIIGIGVGLPTAIGAGVYYATDKSWVAAFSVPFVLIAAFSLIPIPLIAGAFKRFDVARDTPP